MAELVDFPGMMQVYGFRILSSVIRFANWLLVPPSSKGRKSTNIRGKENVGCVFDDKSLSVARYGQALHIVPHEDACQGSKTQSCKCLLSITESLLLRCELSE